MRPEQALTPGLSSRQKGAGAMHVPLGKGLMKDRKRGDSGSAPDVLREAGPEPPSTRGGGEWGW